MAFSLPLSVWKAVFVLRPEPPFTGVSRPSGPEIAKKSQKGSFLGVWRTVSKNTRRSLKIPIFGTFWGIFSVFLDFFGYFLRLFSRPPKRPFLRLFCDFGPGGPGDSCKWRLGSQCFSLFACFYIFFCGFSWLFCGPRFGQNSTENYYLTDSFWCCKSGGLV